MGRNSLHPKGLNHLPVLPPTLHPQDLSPTCPTGVSGSWPPGPSAQLIYGKGGCKQRTRGRRGTKATGLLFAPHWAQSLFTSRCRGAGAQCKEPHLPSKTPPPAVTCWQGFARSACPSSQLWSRSYGHNQHLACSVQDQESCRRCHWLESAAERLLRRAGHLGFIFPLQGV